MAKRIQSVALLLLIVRQCVRLVCGPRIVWQRTALHIELDLGLCSSQLGQVHLGAAK